MNADSRKILNLGLALAPAERVALARELIRSAAAENSSFAGEVGEVLSTYGRFGSQEPTGVVAALPSKETSQMSFTLEYWLEDTWYIGRLREVPGVFSQAETLAELEENIRDAYLLMVDDAASPVPEGEAQRKRIEVRV